MKKLYLLLLLTGTVCFSQTIHPIPVAVADYYNNAVGHSDISDANIILRIETIINNLDGSEPFEVNNNGVNSVYFSKRILAHIQLYKYYDNINDTVKVIYHKNKLEHFFTLLLDEQCISYSAQTECTFQHGGFPANYGDSELSDDLNANPLPTAMALKAFAEVRNLYDSIGQPVPIIGCDEFEDRVYQAKHALYTYQQIHYQFINMDGFIQIAATSIHQLYSDEWSIDFLIEIGTELFDKAGQLRPFEEGDPDWGSRKWSEGLQPDGSWKDYGAIFVDASTTLAQECQKWHDSQLDYHSIITTGLAHLYNILEDGDLRIQAKTHLIASINHIIDYNGHTAFIEHPFNEDVIEDALTPTINDDYAQTRLTGYGRITKYHRELSAVECTNYVYDKRVVGIGFLGSLIFAKNYLDGLSPTEQSILDALISGLTKQIMNTGTGGASGTGANNIPANQLYDLSLFLNMSDLSDIQKNISKDKAIIAFNFNASNQAVISTYAENTTDALELKQDIYSHNQEAVSMVAGDFNGNGSDELIVVFSGGNVYRYQEDSSGNMAITNSVFSSSGVGINAEKVAAGDFNGDGKDELIVLFDDDNMKKYGEDAAGQLVENNSFYVGNGTQHLDVGDFNGDSVDELIIVLEDEMYRYHENTSGNMVQSEIVYDITDDIKSPIIKVGNFNEDDKDELIVASSDGTVTRFEENNSGNLVTDGSENFYVNSSVLVNHLEAADFNLDGEDELIIALNNDQILRYKEDVNSGYLTLNQTIYNGSQACRDLVAGDFNGDGKNELIIAFEFGLIYRYEENSTGILQIKPSFYQSGELTNMMTTLRRNRIHCPGGANLRSTSTTLNTQIEAPQFETILVTDDKTFKLSVKNQTTDTSVLQVYDITGRLLLHETFEQSTQINRSQLNSGMYIFIVQNGSDKKIVKTIN